MAFAGRFGVAEFRFNRCIVRSLRSRCFRCGSIGDRCTDGSSLFLFGLDCRVGADADHRKEYAICRRNQRCQSDRFQQYRQPCLGEDQCIWYVERLHQQQGDTTCRQYQQTGNCHCQTVGGEHSALVPVLFHCQHQPQHKACHCQHTKGDHAGQIAQLPCQEFAEAGTDRVLQHAVPAVEVVAHGPVQGFPVSFRKDHMGFLCQLAAQFLLQQVRHIVRL